MKCSECHRGVKPIVVFDLDGTLGDWHGCFLDFAGWFLNAPFHPAYEYDGTVELHEFMDISLETYREVKLAFRQGGYKRRMQPFSGVGYLTNMLDGAGAEVWIATTRPYLRYDNIDKDTREWLSRNNIPYSGLVYADDKFDMLRQNVDLGRVIGIIDDLPGNISRAFDLGLGDVATLVDRPHNGYSSLPRTDLGSFGNVVLNRLNGA